ncbi:MAG: J domain-containing protein, partial [Opitutales bacterium]
HAHAGGPRGFARGGPGHEFHFGGTTGFSDFFEQFFGTRHGAGPADIFGDEVESEGLGAQPGADTEADLLVSLGEALHGGVRMIRLERTDPHTGEVTTRTIRLRIPVGVRDGQRLRAAGNGSEGRGGAPAGDLYLRVRLAAHPDYRVQGNDLHYDLEIAPWEAVLGANLTVPLPGGRSARLHVPPGTDSGCQLRLRGLGLPRREGGSGDLFAVVSIVVPARLTAEERAQWEKLAQGSRFNPRSAP